MKESAPKRDNAWKVKLFQQFFTGLRNVYGSYSLVTGKGWQVKEPVTDKVILDHLRGRQPYGVYLLVNDRIRAIVADFDYEDPHPPCEFVSRAAHYGISAYIERSKSKGYHVWIFFEDQGVLAAKARLVVRHVLGEIEKTHTEIFPKQDAFDERVKYGNFINTPLFGSLVPKGRTVFIEPSSLKPYPDQWDFLENVVQRVPEKVLDEIIEINDLNNTDAPGPQNPPHEQNNSKASFFGLPPCALQMLNEGVSQNQRVSCFRLAVHLKRIGLPYDIAIAALKVWALKNRPVDGKRIITEKEIIEQASSAFKNGYRSCGCEDAIIAPYCDPVCPVKKTQNGGITIINHHQRKENAS